MDEIIYDLLLKSPLGFALLGTLRFRVVFDEPAAGRGIGDVAALLTATLERPFITMNAQDLEGSIAVQFLTGPRPLPGAGRIFSFDMTPLPLNALLSAGDATRQLFLQFSFLDATHIGGGMLWQPGSPQQMKFSLLGTQRPFGMPADVSQ
ncbi:hypothetical protein SAMN05428959_103139 [Duganella sp. CF517]|uniref:hypothetical protein n=1 Tax=Duganella sp. CF517 TaxID=1881038 RepID=UPI0008B29FA4|nr:hypothetical protein [Duganella sp. CF517]SEN79082.1 hypothetical protein SAMN05428959_103139 [Duganella sp. CF517]